MQIKKIAGLLILIIAIYLLLTGMIGLQKQNLCENALQDALKQYCELKTGEKSTTTYEFEETGTIKIYCEKGEKHHAYE